MILSTIQLFRITLEPGLIVLLLLLAAVVLVSLRLLTTVVPLEAAARPARMVRLLLKAARRASTRWSEPGPETRSVSSTPTAWRVLEALSESIHNMALFP